MCISVSCVTTEQTLLGWEQTLLGSGAFKQVSFQPPDTNDQLCMALWCNGTMCNNTSIDGKSDHSALTQ